MSKSRVCIAGVLAALMAGCASYGPLGTANFEPTLRRDVPAVEGKIQFQSPASLEYGIDGFDLSDQLLAHMKYPPKDKYITGDGIVVLTDQELYFVKWSRDKYEDIWDLDYRKVRSLEIRTFGLGRMLVVKLDGDPQVVSYQIASDSGQTIDAQRTTTVCQLVARNSGKECKLPQ